MRANECVGGFSFSLKELSSVTREYGWYQLFPESIGRTKNEFITESDNVDTSNLVRTASSDAGSRANLAALPVKGADSQSGGAAAAAAAPADSGGVARSPNGSGLTPALSSEDLSSRFGARPVKSSPLTKRKDAAGGMGQEGGNGAGAPDKKAEDAEAKKLKKVEDAEAKAAKKVEAAEVAKKEREAKASKRAEADLAKQAKKESKSKSGSNDANSEGRSVVSSTPAPAAVTPTSASTSPPTPTSTFTPSSTSMAAGLPKVQPITTASTALRRSGSMTSLVSVAAEDVVSSDKIRGALQMSVEVVAAAQRPSHLAAGTGAKPPKHDAVVVTVRACESLAASAPYLKAYLSKNGVDVKRTKTKGDYGAKASHRLPLPTMLEVDIPSALAVGPCLKMCAYY